MKKLKLDLDALKVDTFETTASRARVPRGTVIGQGETEYPYNTCTYQNPSACEPCYPQSYSCGGTCEVTDIMCETGLLTCDENCGPTGWGCTLIGCGTTPELSCTPDCYDVTAQGVTNYCYGCKVPTQYNDPTTQCMGC